MSQTDTDAALRRRAERRVRARFGFWMHAALYLVVNALLVTLNLATSPGELWVIWPILGWGIGLAAHGLSVYAALSGVHDRAVDAEVRRLRERTGPTGQ